MSVLADGEATPPLRAGRSRHALSAAASSSSVHRSVQPSTATACSPPACPGTRTLTPASNMVRACRTAAARTSSREYARPISWLAAYRLAVARSRALAASACSRMRFVW